MPNRIIRESARTSPTLFQLSHGAERLFWRLTTVADDFGRFEADSRIIKAACFPLWADRMNTDQIRKWYGELVTVGLVTSYVVNGKQLGFFNTWEKYQRKRAQSPKYPPPSDDNICRQPLSNAPEKREARSEESRSEESASVTQPLTTPHVTTFHIPEAITTALGKSPRLGATARLHRPDWWQAQLRANPGVDFPKEILRAEAYLVAHPEKHYRDLGKFLHGWLGRADR